jgi:hypothetical protein
LWIHDAGIDRDLTDWAITASCPVAGVETVVFAEPFWVPSPHLIVGDAEVDHRLAGHDVEVFSVPP